MNAGSLVGGTTFFSGMWLSKFPSVPKHTTCGIATAPPSVWLLHVTVRSPQSFCPLKLHAGRTNWPLSCQNVSPCLSVMIGVHHCEHSIVHEEFLEIGRASCRERV